MWKCLVYFWSLQVFGVGELNWGDLFFAEYSRSLFTFLKIRGNGKYLLVEKVEREKRGLFINDLKSPAMDQRRKDRKVFDCFECN